MSYDAWMKKVDQEVSKLCGMSVHDLPDFPSWDLWDAGETPEEAAKEALREAGFQEILGE